MKDKKTAVVAALTSIICVQSGASIAKNFFPIFGPAGMSSFRLGLSSLLLLILNRPNLRLITRKQWLICLAYGICISGMNLIFYYSIERIPLGLAVTVEFIGPLLLALMLSRKLSDLAWASLACLGILLIVPWNSSDIDIIGLLLAFIAGVFWMGYIFMGSKVSKLIDGRIGATIGTTVGAMIVVPIGFYSNAFQQITWTYLFIGFGVAILSSSLPFTFDLLAMKKIPPKSFSILTSLHPAFAGLSGLLFLGEALSAIQWVSILCVVGASIGTTITSGKEE